MDLISVIIPVYNAECYCEASVRSVMNQTYKNLEIIIVDDGSKDQTGKIIDQLAYEDSRIKVIHQDNCGVSRARNVGLMNATGSIVAFADGDDICELTQYERMHSAMTNNDAEISVCALQFEYPHGVVKQDGGGKTEIILMNSVDAIREMYKGVLYSGHVHNKMIKKGLCDGIWFDEDIAICEDTLFMLKVLQRADKVVYSPECLYHYFQRGSSAYHRKYDDKLFSAFKSFLRAEELLKHEKFRSVIPYFKRAQMQNNTVLLERMIFSEIDNSEQYKIILRSMRKDCSADMLSICSFKYKLIYLCIATCPRLYFLIIKHKT